MAKLRIPSLQHMARTWNNSSDLVRREWVRLAKSPPQFSYDPLFGAIRDLLVLKIPYEQVEKGIKMGVKREWVRNLLLEVLPLIQNHFDSIHPDFPPQEVAVRYYFIDRDLKIPFKPPLMFAVGGQFYLLWFSFWRKKPLTGKRLALFMTIVDEIMKNDPDLDSAAFHILDFSIPEREEKRKLVVIDSQDIPRLSQTEKEEMLAVWAQGFRAAVVQVNGMSTPDKKHQEKDDFDERQEELFPKH